MSDDVSGRMPARCARHVQRCCSLRSRFYGQGGSGLAEDPVHFCAAGRAGALGHPAAVRLGGLTVEVALFLAFHAVPVVALRHWWCLSVRGLGRRSALTVLGEETAIRAAEGL